MKTTQKMKKTTSKVKTVVNVKTTSKIKMTLDERRVLILTGQLMEDEI